MVKKSKQQTFKDERNILKPRQLSVISCNTKGRRKVRMGKRSGVCAREGNDKHTTWLIHILWKSFVCISWVGWINRKTISASTD
jgi:hypothetical protein